MTIAGTRHYLWRAVDQDGDVLDIMVQQQRDQKAAERFFKRVLKGQCNEGFVKLRIPAEHEPRFWSNVNANSG